MDTNAEQRKTLQEMASISRLCINTAKGMNWTEDMPADWVSQINTGSAGKYRVEVRFTRLTDDRFDLQQGT